MDHPFNNEVMRGNLAQVLDIRIDDPNKEWSGHCCACDGCLCFGFGHVEERCPEHKEGLLRELQRVLHPYVFVFKAKQVEDSKCGHKRIDVIATIHPDHGGTIVSGEIKMPLGVWELFKKGLVSGVGVKYVINEQ